MRHHLLSSSITMTPASSSSLSKPPTTITNNFNHHNNRKPSSNPNPNSSINNSSSSSPLPCHHSPSATLDILILILVLFSGTFLISSYFSYIFHSLSLLLPTISLSLYTLDISTLYLIAFSLFFFSALLSFELCCGFRSRKCRKLGCKGLKKAMEFDLQLQTEDCLKSAGKAVKEVDQLPWKGGSEGNPDYECLRAELRKMAPPNGRAVLLFRAKCGCPIAKLEGWSLKRGRKHKKNSIKIWAGFFLLVQVIILLDATHSRNDSWVAKDEQKWYIAFLGVSVVCYLAAALIRVHGSSIYLVQSLWSRRLRS